MDHVEAETGRTFILRLHGGEVLHEAVESFSLQNGIRCAKVIAVGGVDSGSKLTVGPKHPAEGKIEPMTFTLDAPREFTGAGTIFSDENGRPLLHMHGSCGREGNSATGCVRSGMIVWLIMEVVITEILCDSAVRKTDPDTGFSLLTLL
ncbi:MAG: PPC domain-containing DNA-binding protein [Candidatus Methanomethylophilaceae archaeon]